MAGRGTDIELGGSLERQIELIEADEALSDEQKASQIAKIREQWVDTNAAVKEAGGLRIIGTERHESRRIDNQLRGRAGRQGDPGSSRFYLSLDDSLMRIFAGDRVRAIMERLRLPKVEIIEARMVTCSIESAQRKVEARNFDIRKQLLQYDDVANDQRNVIYTQRNEVLESESVRDMVINLLEASMTSVFHTYIPEESMEEQWDLVGLENVLHSEYQFELPLSQMIEQDTSLTDEDLLDRVIEKAKEALSAKIEQVGEESWTPFERAILLQSIDTQWRGHLLAMDQLRQGIHLRGYAQRDPRQEYKREAFELFAEMLDRIRDEVVKVLLTVRIRPAEETASAPETPAQQTAGAGINVRYQHADYDAATGQQAANERSE